MSRRGKLPISLPKGVEVTINGETVTVKGPKGELQSKLTHGISAAVEEGVIVVAAPDDPEVAKFHGLHRALVQNMVVGVSEGFTKELEMIGVGYRAAVKGSELQVLAGFSHPTNVAIPTDLSVEVEKNTKIIVRGANRQVVGQFAADVRSLRPPEPYKGKGIRYVGEFVRRKAGKTSK